MSFKRFKDPIYGYIEIKNEIVEAVIDTPEFQRLRDIVQTSYEPLYSSTVHNRFVHSIGVYYLGTIASESIKADFQKSGLKVRGLDGYLKIFELACLLHDIGHAPFSHTGEDFYLNNGERDSLHEEIIKLTADHKLKKEIIGKNYKAAPHELMSVIVALNRFQNLFSNNHERSFFARCILGYPFSIQINKINSFLNCLISVLNSSVIDVDKLDYLIRDAYMTGFDTVSLDYERLLTQIRIVYDGKGLFKAVYGKGVISVIENVVYAHDAERKWIQTHPVVQYESFLIQTAMQMIKKKYKEVEIFSYKALSTDGVELSDGYKVSLLSDADIRFLMKNLDDICVIEYYDRRRRRHPLWKSESEYKAVFSRGFRENDFVMVETGLEGVCKLCKSRVLDMEALEKCRDDIKKTEILMKKYPHNKEKWSKNIESKKRCVRWLEALERFAKDQGIAFDFVVLNTKQFNSGFTKSEFAKIEVLFDSLNKPCLFGDVTNVLKADSSDRENYIYIYYRRNNTPNDVDVNKLAIELGRAAINETSDNRKNEMESVFSQGAS